MGLRTLPRYALDLRQLGVNEQPAAWQTGFTMPAFPQNNDGGTSSGGGAAGGTGSTGTGSTDSTGDQGDDEDQGDTGTTGMTAEEQIAHWKKMSRKHERAAKSAPKPEELEQLRKDAAEMEKIREANKSETEKALSRAEKAEKELVETKARQLRTEVAYAAGLPANLASRLVGSTKEELEADAKELLKLAGNSQGTAGRRAPGLDQGTRGTRDESKASVASGAELYAQRHKKTTTQAS